MPNPGAFRGSRKIFLQEQLPAYKAAIQGNYAADFLADVQRRYFKRYPIDLPHNEEPSSEHLDEVDDNTPDIDITSPDLDSMSEEERAKIKEALDEREEIILFRKAQIKRWMAYHYAKERDLPPKESGSFNPYSLLLHKLTGVGVSKPRKKAAYNVWGKTQAEIIEKKVKAEVTERSLKAKDLANIRCQITRKLFQELPPEEQKEWETQAKEDHKNAADEWEKALKSAPSTSPEDRQLCIERLPNFVQPILDLICEHTGWKATLITGGPEPADGGRLNVLSIHSGIVAGPVGMNFGRSEREAYKKHVIPVYSRFLKKCYTVQECRERALSNESMTLSKFNTEEDAWSLDHVDEAALNPTRTDSRQTNANSIPLDCPKSPNHLDSYAPSPSSRPTLPPSRAPSSSRPTLPPSRAPSPSSRPTLSPSRAPSPGIPASRPSTPVSVSRDITFNSPTTALPCPSPVPEPATTAPIQPSPIAEPGPAALQSVSSTPVASITQSPALTPVSPRTSSDDGPLSPPCPSVESSTSARHVKRPREVDNNLDKEPRKRTRSNNSSSTSSRHVKRPREVDNNPDKEPRKRSERSNHSSSSQAGRNPPQWLTDCILMLNRDDWGNDWQLLVFKWANLEKAYDTETNSQLPTTSRPPIIGAWIKRARSHTWRPSITNMKRYQKQFWKWWTVLQPEWRKRDAELVDVNLGSDWSSLRMFGKNGLVSVMASLYFWGCNLEPESDGWEMWRIAVADVANVINAL